KDLPHVAKMKAMIGKAEIGHKKTTIVTITVRPGTQIVRSSSALSADEGKAVLFGNQQELMGYINLIDDDSFTLTDPETRQISRIAYSDVLKVTGIDVASPQVVATSFK